MVDRRAASSLHQTLHALDFIRNRHAAFIQVSEEVMVSTSTRKEGRPTFFVSHEQASILSVLGSANGRRVEMQW